MKYKVDEIIKQNMNYIGEVSFEQKNFDDIAEILSSNYSIKDIMSLSYDFHYENCTIGETSIGDGEIDRCDDRYDMGIEFYKQWQYRLINLAITNAKNASDFQEIESWTYDIFKENKSIQEIKIIIEAVIQS